MTIAGSLRINALREPIGRAPVRALGGGTRLRRLSLYFNDFDVIVRGACTTPELKLAVAGIAEEIAKSGESCQHSGLVELAKMLSAEAG